jgi:uncharacterized protein
MNGMARFFIIHGTKSDPHSNWFPWIKNKLESLGHEVHVPRFPTPNGQNLESWMKILKEYNVANSILIGHSLGVAFILTVIERFKVEEAFLISGFLGDIGIKEYDRLNKSFATRVFDWNKIKKNCQRFHVISSDNDPYVNMEKSVELATKLGVKFEIIPNAGHINSESGYTKFDYLLSILNRSYG